MNEGKIITQTEQAKHCPKNSCRLQQTRGPLSYAQIYIFFILFYFILFYNHTWPSLTIQLHGTYLQQDYKIYLRYSFTTYLFATYLH